MDFFSGRGVKFYEFSVKLMELMWLNVLVLITSLPIFTIGASFSAMHTVLIKIYRDEEDKITQEYFSAFKNNFKQATLLWLIYLGVFGLLLLDDFAMRLLENPTLKYLDILVPVLAFVTILSMCWAFVLQCRYKLSIKDIFLFSFTRVIAFPFRSIFMALTLIVPLLIAYYFPGLLITVFLLGLSVPGILSTCFYNRALMIMEDDSEKQEQETEEETEDEDSEEEDSEEDVEEETVITEENSEDANQ